MARKPEIIMTVTVDPENEENRQEACRMLARHYLRIAAEIVAKEKLNRSEPQTPAVAR